MMGKARGKVGSRVTVDILGSVCSNNNHDHQHILVTNLTITLP